MLDINYVQKYTILAESFIIYYLSLILPSNSSNLLITLLTKWHYNILSKFDFVNINPIIPFLYAAINPLIFKPLFVPIFYALWPDRL